MYVAHTRIYPISNTFEPPRIERQSKKKKREKEIERFLPDSWRYSDKRDNSNSIILLFEKLNVLFSKIVAIQYNEKDN